MTNEEMAQFIAQGDSPELVPLLWEKTKALCYQLAQRRYVAYKERATACGIEFADIRQECYFAFLAALKDYTQKPQTVKFTSFLKYHTTNTINSLIGLRTERQRREPLNNCLSLDEPLPGYEDDITLSDVIVDREASEPFEDVEQRDVYRILNESVSSLDEPQRATIKARFYEGRTLKETGEQLNVFESEAQKLERNALRNLRKMKKIRQIGYDFYGFSTGITSYRLHGISSVERAVEHREMLIDRLYERI